MLSDIYFIINYDYISMFNSKWFSSIYTYILYLYTILLIIWAHNPPPEKVLAITLHL